MTKDLEVLEIIKSIQTNNYDRRINDYTSVNEECEYEISIIEKELKALEIIKKHFIIKLEEETDLNGNVWGRLVSIQSKEDEGTWDTTACANIVNCKEDFDLLEEMLGK